MKKYTFSIIGGGKLSKVIIDAYEAGKLPKFELKGILKNTKRGEDQQFGYDVYYDVEEFLKLKTDFVVEAAAKDALIAHGRKVVENGSDLVVLSIGALSDDDFFKEIKDTLDLHNRKMYLASGAVGGFDVMRTIELMGPTTTTLYSKKNPDDLKGTVLYKEELKDIQEVVPVFKATTREAFKLLPTKVNIAIATALAGSGIDETTMEMEAYPNFKGDHYFIEIEGQGATAKMDIYSRTDEIAAWSVVHVLNNAVSSIVF